MAGATGSGGARSGAGRKPTPIELKRLRGNPGKRPLPSRSQEIVVSDEVPPVPSSLGAQAGPSGGRCSPGRRRPGSVRPISLWSRRFVSFTTTLRRSGTYWPILRPAASSSSSPSSRRPALLSGSAGWRTHC